MNICVEENFDLGVVAGGRSPQSPPFAQRELLESQWIPEHGGY